MLGTMYRPHGQYAHSASCEPLIRASRAYAFHGHALQAADASSSAYCPTAQLSQRVASTPGKKRPSGHAAHSVDEHAGSVARLTTEHGAAELDPSDPGQV